MRPMSSPWGQTSDGPATGDADALDVTPMLPPAPRDSKAEADEDVDGVTERVPEADRTPDLLGDARCEGVTVLLPRLREGVAARVWD